MNLGDNMKMRLAKRFDQKISEVGFGAWQLGGTDLWGNMTREEGVKLVLRAVEEGVTFFDTAPGYGGGNSELILGEALEGIRDKVFINTKVGHGPNGEHEFSKEGIENSITRSLLKLKTTYLDSVILHNPERYILEGESDLFEALKHFKDNGIIKGYGVSVDSIEELELVLNNLEVDTIEVMFNVIHQETKEAFDRIHEKGILLIIKVPLDSGWLTGKYNKNSEFSGIRSRWNQEVINTRSEIVEKIKEIVKADSLVLPALRFILGFKAVTVIIPGTKNELQLLNNIEASDNEMDMETVQKLEELYETYIKNQYTPW
mgnify:CR=1 FL=1